MTHPSIELPGAATSCTLGAYVQGAHEIRTAFFKGSFSHAAELVLQILQTLIIRSHCRVGVADWSLAILRFKISVLGFDFKAASLEASRFEAWGF